MFSKPWFRCVVSLLVVCVLLINCSPIKADAIALADDVLIGLGLFALLAAGAAGIVFTPQNDSEIKAIGNDFYVHMYQWGTGAEKLEEVESWLDSARIVGGGSDQDGDGDIDPDDKVIKIGTAVTAGVATWLGKFAVDHGFIEIKPTNPDGTELVQIGSFVPAGTKVSCMDGTYISSDHDAQVVRCRLQYSGKYYYRTCFVYASTDSKAHGKVTIYNSDGTTSTNSGTRNTNRLNTHKYYGYVQDYSFYVAENASLNTYFPLQPSNVWDLYYGVIDKSYIYNVPSESVSPASFVGDVSSGLADGSISVDDLQFSDLTYGNIEVKEDETEKEAILGVMSGLNDGSLSYDDYLALVAPEVKDDSASDPTTGTDTNPPVSVNNEVNRSFLYRLMDYLLAGIQKIWDTLGTLFTTYIVNPIKEFWSQSIALIEAGVFWETLASTITAPLEALGNMILEGIRSIFVPDADFLTAKVEAIRAEFAFADAIISTGEYIGSSLSGLTTEPPVIYVNLGDTRGSYNLGGKVAFLDLRWYAEYKPVGDAIIAAFLWLCFAWRMYVKAPGIIRGIPGDFHAVRDISGKE